MVLTQLDYCPLNSMSVDYPCWPYLVDLEYLNHLIFTCTKLKCIPNSFQHVIAAITVKVKAEFCPIVGYFSIDFSYQSLRDYCLWRTFFQ